MSEHGVKQENGESYILCSFWYWRRVISLVVLTAFINTLCAPAFALYKTVDNETNKASEAKKIGSESKNTNNETKQDSVKSNELDSFIRFKSNNNSSYFAPAINLPKNKLFSSKNKYLPYFEMGGVKYFNQNSNVAGVYDLFIPLLQANDSLLFTDLRLFDRSGSSFEGNIHLGYRKLYPDKKQLVGIYAAFDRKRTEHKNWFNQVMVGAEYWNNKLFVGGNFYKPIGKTREIIKSSISITPISSRSIAVAKRYETPLAGLDGEVGFSFTDNFTGYAGGYYFYGNGVSTTAGPKLRLTYNYNHPHRRILGVLDGIGIEAGMQHDKPRGISGYVGIKLKIGLTSLEKNSNLFGFERHMTELVRRDPDIVVGKTKPEYEYYHSGVKGFRGGNSGDQGWHHTYKNLEEILEEFGLPKDATLQDVKRLYRKYALKYHPDRNKGIEGTPLYEENVRLFMHYTGIYEELKTRFVRKGGKEGDRGSNDRSRSSNDRSSKSNFQRQSSVNFSISKQDFQTYEQPDEGSHVEEDGVPVKLQLVLKASLDIIQKNKVVTGRELEAGERWLKERRSVINDTADLIDFAVDMKMGLRTRVKPDRLSKLDKSNESIISNNLVSMESEIVGDLWKKAVCKEANLVDNVVTYSSDSISNVTEVCLAKPILYRLNTGLGTEIAWLIDKINEGITWSYRDPKTMLLGVATVLSSGWVATKYFLGYLFSKETKVRRSRKKRKRGKRRDLYFGPNDDDDDDDDDFPFGEVIYSDLLKQLNRDKAKGSKGKKKKKRGRKSYSVERNGYSDNDDNDESSSSGGFPSRRRRNSKKSNKWWDWKNIFKNLPLFFTMTSGGMAIPLFVPRNDINEELNRLLGLSEITSVSNDHSGHETVQEEDALPIGIPNINEKDGDSSLSIDSETKCLVDILRKDHDCLGGLVPLLTLSDWNYHTTTKKLKRKAESEKRVRKREEQGTVEDADTIEKTVRPLESEDATTREATANLDYEYEDRDIAALLPLRAQEAGLDIVRGAAVILPPLDYREVQLREQLEDERRRYRSEGRSFARTILVPLHVLHLGRLDHWAGLVIRLNRVDQVRYIEYVDSLGNRIPSEVEATLRTVYGEDVVIRNVQGSWQTDGIGCGPLMVENLIQAAQNRLRPQIVEDREMRAIRGHHVELLERYRPELQFNFRQGRNVRSFECETSGGLKLDGGFFAGFPAFPSFSLDLSKERNLFSFPNLKMATHGGMLGEIVEESEGEGGGESLNDQEVGIIPLLNIYKVTLQLIKYVGYSTLAYVLFNGINIIFFLLFSNLGKEFLAAGTLISGFQNFLFSSCANGLFIESNFVKRSFDIEDYFDIGLTLQQGWIMAITLAVPSIILSVFAGDIFLHIFRQSPNLCAIAQDYFRAYAWGIPANYMLINNIQTVVGMGRPSFLPAAILFQGVTIVGLSFVFLSILRLGPAGLGYAYSIGSWIAFLETLMCLAVIECKSQHKYGFFDFYRNIRLRLKRFTELLMVGLPITIRFSIELISLQLCIAMAGWLGTDVLRGTGIALQYLSLFLIPATAIGQFAGMLGGGFVKKGIEFAKKGMKKAAKVNFRNAARFGNIGIIMNCISPTIAVILFVAIPKPLISVYMNVNDPSNAVTVSTARFVLLILGGGILQSIREASAGALRSFLDTSFSMAVSLLGMAVILIPLAYLLAFPGGLGVYGIFIAADVGMGLCAGSLSIRWIIKSRRSIARGWIDDKSCWTKLVNKCSQVLCRCKEYFRWFFSRCLVRSTTSIQEEDEEAEEAEETELKSE